LVRFANVSMHSKLIRVGDKIATQHGQKFTVSEIRPKTDMPKLVCNTTNEEFYPQILVACSSIHNRDTLGQIYEGWAAMSVIKVFNPNEFEGHVVVDSSSDSIDKLEPWTCSIIGPDERVLTKPNGKHLIVDYGVCSFWPLSHLVRDKQQYMNREIGGLAPVKGKLRGGPVRTSELEVHSLLLAGMIKTLSYLSDVSDTINVSICTGCRRLTLLCDCSTQTRLPSIYVRVRNSLVKLDIFRAVYSINATQRHVDNLTNEEMSTVILPSQAESFVYET
jgi:DNA-directed RNA polymerase beta subunit